MVCLFTYLSIIWREKIKINMSRCNKRVYLLDGVNVKFRINLTIYTNEGGTVVRLCGISNIILIELVLADYWGYDA